MTEAVLSGITDHELAEFSARLAAAHRREEAVPITGRVVDGKPVVWAPQPGSQTEFLNCPIFETLYHGTRGPGKTDALLMSFAQHVGKGYGQAWRGVIFRQTYPQLADVQVKSEKWFRRIFPQARFNVSKMYWQWPTGETLLFRHMMRPQDYWNYHGHEFPFIGFEELTNWATDECYKLMFACCRSSTPGIPHMYRATTNPYGVGHNWVKDRFQLAGRWWRTTVQLKPLGPEGTIEPARCAIHGHIDENRILLAADPTYKTTIAAAASNAAMAEAWVDGSWDIVAGGMFDDVWNPERNILPVFKVPGSWRLDRSFDWGSTKPFSVGWWARSDGSDLRLGNGRTMSTVRGDLFRVEEWYGWTGRANEGRRMLAVEVAAGIVEREIQWGWRQTPQVCPVRAGVADSAITTVENGRSIAMDMQQPVRVGNLVYPGVSWHSADKRPGSRKSGWEQVRKYIRAATPPKNGVREEPGLFVVGDRCQQFLRTFPVLPRDPKDMDDADTEAEDHIADEVRYRVRFASQEIGGSSTIGMY